MNNNTMNNEWILSKPTPMGNIEQWRFVRSVEGMIELYHNPEHAEEYVWNESMTLEDGRDTWRTMVKNGFNFNREKIV